MGLRGGQHNALGLRIYVPRWSKTGGVKEAENGTETKGIQGARTGGLIFMFKNQGTPKTLPKEHQYSLLAVMHVFPTTHARTARFAGQDLVDFLLEAQAEALAACGRGG